MHTHRMGLGLVLITTQMVLACATVGSAGSGDALTDTGWKLSALPGQTSLTGRPATLHFSEGRVHGSDGCNRYSGTYNAAGEKFNISENLALTKMACPEPLMRQAEAFTRALTKASAWRKEAGQLVLLDSGGRELATLAAQPQDLAATSWRVTGYNNGKQAVVGILAGSELTLAFAADGKLAGAAGCNNYTASFTTFGERIEIGQAAATRKVCSQPEGIMEQEDRFLNALASAATWRLDGDRLELRTAAGALALSLSAADSAAVWTTEPRRAALPSLVFLCGDLRVLLTHHGERMQLSVGGEIFAMQQIEAASGAIYVAVDDATTSFWSKGDAATLVVRGQAYPNCMQVTAKASPFRTVSRHPG